MSEILEDAVNMTASKEGGDSMNRYTFTVRRHCGHCHQEYEVREDTHLATIKVHCRACHEDFFVEGYDIINLGEVPCATQGCNHYVNPVDGSIRIM